MHAIRGRKSAAASLRPRGPLRARLDVPGDQSFHKSSIMHVSPISRRRSRPSGRLRRRAQIRPRRKSAVNAPPQTRLTKTWARTTRADIHGGIYGDTCIFT